MSHEEAGGQSAPNRSPEEVLRSLPAEGPLSEEQLTALIDATQVHLKDRAIENEYGGRVHSKEESIALDEKLRTYHTITAALIDRYNVEIRRRDAERSA
jgi:hypothetical protein